MKFSEMPSAGLWVNHPQHPLEGAYELDKIKAMLYGGIETVCYGDETYQCLDSREQVEE